MPQHEGAPVSYANQSACLDVATGCFRAAVDDRSGPCSGTHERPCHIIRQLTACNELLFPARMQLREIPGARGQLALVSIDGSCRLLPGPQDFHLRQSAGFMHSLLKHHKCVASLDVTRSHFDKYSSPLCDALPLSCLKKLTLSCGFPMSRGICAVIPSLTSLEELELDCASSSDSCAEFPTALAALVRASPFLVALSLAGISMEEQATKHLLASLTESGVLKDLTLDGRVVPECCRGELSQYLMSSSSLTSLSFTDESEKTEITVLEGILHSRTISKVCISAYTGNAEIIQLVARILSKNTVVKSFAISSTREEVFLADRVAYDTWLDALGENETLEKLWIFYRIWNRQQWIRFTHILSSKQRLKVYIFCCNKNDHLFTHVYRTLEDSGVHDKASCGLYLVKDNADLLKCKVFSGLFFDWDAHEGVQVTALRQMLDCSHLKSLIIDIRRGNLAVSSALAEYVQSTPVLRELQIEVRTALADELNLAGGAWWRLIVNSLSRNNSIKDLNISGSDMSDGDVESLADAVSAKTNIRKLSFAACGMMTLSAFVNRLSVGIVGNHTLLGVALCGRLDQEGQDASRKLFAIYEATRRNSGLLAAAAAFPKATDAHRYSDAALERICKRHTELLKDLAELMEVSVAEIGGMAHRHLRRTASLDAYMRITGVVKERVVCHPRDDGRIQLDDLGEDCWEMVRRFLMLDDVEEAVIHPENRSAIPAATT
ncbi:hypothetical protein HPB52_008543 [Rhipicephalus sanguineus]|uniref:Uncharacterized protein n=1 Tax=Rhipicephalus sanguineus TaxID=34632 RepID=A0A9D4Q5Q7_RHISA|nr:hypothetical protein HPB52_008543 [Rhipicephalus sanguineus]